MKFKSNNWYHIYNRGNNKQPIFFQERNYTFFLEKMKKYILPSCDVIAYALMPNHFHFLIAADERTEKEIPARIATNPLSEGIRMLLSSYTKAIQRQEEFIGNLFQQRTQSKIVLDFENINEGEQYANWCIHYIHQNPLKAGLVNKMEDWQYSSFRDYAGLRKGTFCNYQKGLDLLEMKPENFYTESPLVIPDKALKGIFV